MDASMHILLPNRFLVQTYADGMARAVETVTMATLRFVELVNTIARW